MTQVFPPEMPWYARTFDRAWLDLYPHRNDEEARTHAPGLCRLLGIKPGSSVLDVACGAGRYARAFAALGMRVTGVDISPELIAEARERNLGLPGYPSYFRTDARKMPFQRQFDAAVCLFTSFGYSEDREDDVAMFRRVHRALRGRGRFVLDFLNEGLVRANLVAEESRVDGETRIDVTRWIDETDAGDFVCKEVVSTGQRGRDVTSFEERVRLYTADEVRGLLEEAGLHVIGEPFGDLDGSVPFGPEAERLVFLSERR